VGTVIQDIEQRHPESQPRWDRFERADLYEQYRDLQTRGLSERQAAKDLKVPRTTLQAWRLWHRVIQFSVSLLVVGLPPSTMGEVGVRMQR